MRAAVITGGERPSGPLAHEWLQSCGIVVAADSGVEACIEWGVEPSHIVGDWDSIEDRTLLQRFPEAQLMTHEHEKDETDTELAILTARQAGGESVVLLGGGGGRLDHLLANVALFDRDEAPEAWLTAGDEVRLVTKELRLDVAEGSTISVFPVGAGPWKMESEGLKWPLAPLEWRRGDVGVSNVATASPAYVRMKSGRVIVVRSAEEGGKA